MRSPLGTLVGTLVNKTPVPYVSRAQVTIPWAQPTGAEQQLRAMGSVGTLFAIVDRLANSTAAAEWTLYRKPARPMRGVEEDDQPHEVVTSHAALTVWEKPNPFMTRQEFLEASQQHFELTGEAWWVAAFSNARSLGPIELWPVRPDRMDPVPHPVDFLAGYVYRGPDGGEIPLKRDEVIQLRRPNPVDPYRGLGAVQTILTDLEGVRLSAEWNRNFFLNSAEPGGIIEVPDTLDDDAFDQMVLRWQEQHRGVANAHRVAIIEQGKWVERKYTNRDMEFTALRAAGREVIREAFGMPKFAVGDVEDINRATANASRTWFAEEIIIPRLERIKQALNNDFLPMFGATAEGLYFDYESPVPEDDEAEAAVLKTRAETYKILIDAGRDSSSAAEVAKLPDMPAAQAAPAPAAAPALEPPAGLQPAIEPPAARIEVGILPQSPPAPRPAPAGPRARAATPSFLALAAATRPYAQETAQDGTPLPTLENVQASWEQALAGLLAEWAGVVRNQIIALIDKVKQALRGGNVTDLTTITAPTAQAEEALRRALVVLAESAAAQVVGEAADQGVTIPGGAVDAAVLGQIAVLTAAGMADELALSARREAQRVWRPGVPVGDVVSAVTTKLEALTEAGPRQYLGGALTQAQHEGRAATFQAAEDAAKQPPKPPRPGEPAPPERAIPSVAYYGQEILDSNTCPFCREIDGRWLGNTLADARRDYPMGGYVRCQGRERCRGQVVAVWRGGTDPSKWIEKEPVP